MLLLLAHRYSVEGIVVDSKPEQRLITVAHRPIENYMPAMTMTFRTDRAIALTPGTRVGFELEVSKTSSVARKIRVREAAIDLTLPKPPVNQIPIGQKIPSFTLTDQAGKTVSLTEFFGRVVVVDFIYTRCPLPDVCPRLSANFASLSKKLRGQGVEFLSITIDPQYDTPAVLTEYARRWQADGESWRFLTGTPQQIQETAGYFGLIFWPEEGSMTHTVSTAVLGRDGTLVAKIDGAGYRPDQLRALIDHAMRSR